MIWFRKIRSIFVHVKKIVFGIEKLDTCSLNKTNSFGFFKKKISDLILRTRNIGFWFVLKKSDLFYNKKNLDLYIGKIRSVFLL